MLFGKDCIPDVFRAVFPECNRLNCKSKEEQWIQEIKSYLTF